MKKIQLKFKFYLFDIILLPINILIYSVYRNIVPTLLSYYLKKSTNANIQVFIRQGLTNEFKRFNFFFSDIDIGIIIEDNFDVTNLKQSYYQLKKYFRALGEIEIYTATEFDLYSKKPQEFLNLYYKIRKVRQLNWLRGRVKEQKGRSIYHRLKDHRKILNLTSELNLKSSYDSINSIYWDLKEYTERESEFIFKIENLNFDFVGIHCDYISQYISFKNQPTRKLFLLAAMPTQNRRLPDLDSIISQIRLNNPQIEQVFLQLNEYELLIAKAFIRGAANHELWHKPWLFQLEEGIKKQLDHPYCMDAFSRLRITSEGDVFFCCYQRQHPLGNLQFQSLEEIKNSPLARDTRESIIKGEMHKTCLVMACPHAYKERHATSTEVINKISYNFLDIDPPNSHCNIGGERPSDKNPACIMCERSLPNYRFESDFSKTILPKINAAHFNFFHIQGVSEPFFQNLIFNYLDLINYKNTQDNHVSTVTNVVLFDNVKQERWIKSINRTSIGFSIDASTRKTYKEIRRIDSFDLVIKNITNYSELIKNSPDHSFKIQNNINIINLNEVEDMVIFAKEVGAFELEFNLTGGHPEHILINNLNEHLFIEAANKILKKAQEVNQRVVFLRPFHL